MQDPGPFFRGSHKGSYGTPEPRSAASAAARASRTWAARGAPTAAATAAPHPVLVPFGCAGCGVGVPQGRRGFATNLTCAAAGTFLAPAGGHQPPHPGRLSFPQHGLWGPRQPLPGDPPRPDPGQPHPGRPDAGRHRSGRGAGRPLASMRSIFSAAARVSRPRLRSLAGASPSAVAGCGSTNMQACRSATRAAASTSSEGRRPLDRQPNGLRGRSGTCVSWGLSHHGAGRSVMSGSPYRSRGRGVGGGRRRGGWLLPSTPATVPS